MSISTVVSAVRNIQFTLEDHGQEFTFMCSINGTNEFGTARLQLPTTPDSENTISIAGEELEGESENYSIVYKSLRDDFYASFNSKECGKASIQVDVRVYAVEQVADFYVCFADNGSAHILKEGRLSQYYDVFYFAQTDASDFQDENESDIVKAAEKSLSESLKNELEAGLSEKLTGYQDEESIKQAADEFTHEFMCSKFHAEYANDDGFAQEFYQMTACDLRSDAESEAISKTPSAIMEDDDNKNILCEFFAGIASDDYYDGNSHQLYLDLNDGKLSIHFEASSNSWLQRDDGSLIQVLEVSGYANTPEDERYTEGCDLNDFGFEDWLEYVKTQISKKI